MTIDQIRPCRKPYAYRNRDTGQLATVVAFSSKHQMAKLATASGGCVMTAGAFWDAWVHADLYDPARN